MTTSTMLHIRVDEALKIQASSALEAMGLSLSDAVRLLLKRVASEQAWPLELKVPNAETQAAMREARAMAVSRSSFADAQQLFAALDAEAAQTQSKAKRLSLTKPRARPIVA